MAPKKSQNPESLLLHADFVRGLARGLLFDSNSADDAVQGTWVAAVESPPAAGANPRGWLGTVLRNFVRQRKRGDRRRNRREEDGAKKEGLPSVADVVEREAMRREVVDAVLELDESSRTAILLRYYEDLPPREIARKLDVPVETARTRIKRALEKLRNKLDEEHQGDRNAWGALLPPFVTKESVMATAGGSAVLGSTAVKAAAAAVVLVGGGVAWYAMNSSSSDDDVKEAAVIAKSDPAPASPLEGTQERADAQLKAPQGPGGSASDPQTGGPGGRTVVVSQTTGVTFRGSVLANDAAFPVEGAVVLFSRVDPEEIDYDREWPWWEEGPHDYRAVTDADGKFALTLEPEDATRVVWAKLHYIAPGWFLTTGEGRRWQKGTPEDRIAFRVEAQPIGKLRVQAKAKDSGQPLEGFIATMTREGNYSREHHSEGTVAERYVSLPQGTTSATFTVGIEDPRVIADSQVVELAQGATVDVELAYEWGREISGTVVDEDGNALADAVVFFGYPSAMRGGRPNGAYEEEHVPHASRTDAAGDFTIRGSGGLLTAWHDDHSPVSVPVAEADRIELEPRSTIRGRILRPDGTPFDEGWITLDRSWEIPLNPDGTFEFAEVEAGSHGLTFPPERWVTVHVEPGDVLEVEIPELIPEVALEVQSGGVPLNTHREMDGIVVGLDDVAGLFEFRRHDDGKVRLRRVVPGRYVTIQHRGLIGYADVRGAEGVLDVGDKSLRILGPPGTKVYAIPEGLNAAASYWARRQLTQEIPADGVVGLDPLPAGDYVIGIANRGDLTTVTVDRDGTEVSLHD